MGSRRRVRDGSRHLRLARRGRTHDARQGAGRLQDVGYRCTERLAAGDSRRLLRQCDELCAGCHGTAHRVSRVNAGTLRPRHHLCRRLAFNRLRHRSHRRAWLGACRQHPRHRLIRMPLPWHPCPRLHGVHLRNGWAPSPSPRSESRWNGWPLALNLSATSRCWPIRICRSANHFAVE